VNNHTEQQYEEVEHDDFDMRGRFTKACDGCQRVTEVRTQHDNCPEYYTTVSVLCQCGKYVTFTLPVN
jgi:hypothetical protein